MRPPRPTRQKKFEPGEENKRELEIERATIREPVSVWPATAPLTSAGDGGGGAGAGVAAAAAPVDFAFAEDCA